MTDTVLQTGRVALVGNPNSGKTALFNALTGARQKVANYAGVTVERKEGQLTAASGRTLSVLDLPGTYSLRARSPDEVVTRDAVLGQLAGETPPDAWPPRRSPRSPPWRWCSTSHSTTSPASACRVWVCRRRVSRPAAARAGRSCG